MSPLIRAPSKAALRHGWEKSMEFGRSVVPSGMEFHHCFFNRHRSRAFMHIRDPDAPFLW